MALLYRTQYKKYIVDHVDIINDLFKKNYSFPIYITVSDSGEVLFSKMFKDDGIVYTYDEVETSIQFIDDHIKPYINFYLFSQLRQNYLLDTIKRIWDVSKAEDILSETIKKWYIN